MVKEIKLYVEGGAKGSHKVTTIKIQQGFDSFFRELKDAAREKKVSFKVILSGNTQNAYDDFMLSVENSPQSFSVLLVDSDGEVGEDESARDFLQNKYKSWKLKNIKENQCHLMVQMMESWFLADKEKLAVLFGKGFNKKALPKNAEVEKILKGDVENGLKNATRKSQKGIYHKGKHSGEILQKIDSNLVREAAPNCRRLFITIIEAIGE